jgi:hypothetical protein
MGERHVVRGERVVLGFQSYACGSPFLASGPSINFRRWRLRAGILGLWCNSGTWNQALRVGRAGGRRTTKLKRPMLRYKPVSVVFLPFTARDFSARNLPFYSSAISVPR